MSWNDCQEFFKRLNQKIPELKLCLPTEAQWEYACRAGTTTQFSFGANITPEQVNYDGNYPYSSGKQGEYRKKTVPVKSLPANPWGLFEMHGNVYEWCEDAWGDYQPGFATNPVNMGEDDGVRVVRGGSWLSIARGARSAHRNRRLPHLVSDNYLGFRVSGWRL